MTQIFHRIPSERLNYFFEKETDVFYHNNKVKNKEAMFMV